MNLKSKYNFLGNNLAVDFTNTEHIAHGDVVETLQNLNDFYQWTSEAGLEAEAFSKTDSINEVIELRTSLKELFVSAADDNSLPDKALKTVNHYLLNRSETQQIKKIDNKMFLEPKYKRLSLKRLLGVIAHEAAQLLVSPQLHQLKHCSNTKCILLFLDTSKSKKRRWCSMDTCGNRAKAASHYLNSKKS
ncbi:MAG: hypothetical protein COA95_00405 [Methylophaga sp.]|nr:MAG: hypothetical protein COA95_00405 [Methylophaga sp.]